MQAVLAPDELFVGMMYPFREPYLTRFFTGGNVFYKFVGRYYPTVRAGEKILLYRSGGSKHVVGEGTIAEKQYLDSDKVLSKYSNRAIISRDELLGYIKQRRRPERRGYYTGHLVTFVLRSIIKYRKPFKMDKAITRTGLKVTKKMYERITRHVASAKSR